MTKFLRLSEVLNRTGMSRSTLYEQISAGSFPKPVKVSSRTNGWPDNEIAEWIAERVRQRDNAMGEA